ncbi:MAG: nucleotidyltransferase family protein [Clostridia bacterium]|jgi:CTP:molybdopterin cytidylyltransferase MocA|nr:nucleotidyltransferase family protein [Clostridia bacterium]
MSARVALVVLAAGRSLRYGSDKLRSLSDGEPMLLRALRLYAGLPFVSKTVVLSPDRIDFADAAETLGYRVVINPRPKDGQSQSVRLGVEAARAAQPDGVLCSVSDQPYLTEGTVQTILERFASDPGRIVRPVANGIPGNPVLFPADCLEELCLLTGDVGGSAVIRRHADRVTCIATEERELTDVDRKTEA